MRSSASLFKMEVFAKVVECGSLSKAATELGITPSAVSKSISALEEFLGTTLLKRTTRSIALTESGRAIHQSAISILKEVEQVVEEAKSFEKPSGVLRISCSIAFGCTQLPSVLGGFADKYPGVEVLMSLDDRCVNLAEENYDLAIRVTNKPSWDYPARNLGKIEWVYCASPEYLMGHPPLDDPEDLKDHRCLVYPNMTVNGAWAFLKNENYKEVKIRGPIMSNSSLGLIHLAAQGGGIVCAPKYAVADKIRSGELVLLFPGYQSAISHSLYAMYFKTKIRSPVVRAFLDHLVSCYDKSFPWDADD